MIFEHSRLYDVNFFIKKPVEKSGDDIHLTNLMAPLSKNTHHTLL